MLLPNRPYKRGDIKRSQPLLADENYRRPSSADQSENLREITIQRDYHPGFAGCVVEDLGVGSLAHLDFTDMHGIPAIVSQDHGGR